MGPINAAKAQGLSGNSLHIAIPKVFGPVFTRFERKPGKAFEHLLKEKKGCCPGVFYHKKLGPIGLAYGRTIEGDPEDRGGYALAHIEKKHPGFWKNIQPILDNGRLLGEEEGAIEYADKLHFTDGEALVVITRYWAKDKSTGAWVITAFEPTTGKKYLDRLEKKLLEEIKQRKEALERNSRLHQVTNYRQMGLPPNERGDSLSQQSKGDYFPNLRTIVRWATADQSTLLHETGHWFVEARIGVARDLEQKPNLTTGEQH